LYTIKNKNYASSNNVTFNIKDKVIIKGVTHHYMYKYVYAV